jgi:hypothetical protein
MHSPRVVEGEMEAYRVLGIGESNLVFVFTSGLALLLASQTPKEFSGQQHTKTQLSPDRLQSNWIAHSWLFLSTAGACRQRTISTEQFA